MSSLSIPDPLPTPEEDSQKLRKAFQGNHQYLPACLCETPLTGYKDRRRTTKLKETNHNTNNKKKKAKFLGCFFPGDVCITGWGTDEKAIIDILSRRNAAQRREIARAYHSLYNEPLLKSLDSELSGDFGRAMVLWAMDPAERDAKLANEALKRKGERHVWILIEIACASSPDHLMDVRQAYCSLFTSSLEEDVAIYFAQQSALKQLLVRLISSYRYDGDRINEDLAKSEAKQFYDAIRKQQPHSEEVLRVLSLRSKSQLNATFKHYKQDYGISIDEDIDGNSGGDQTYTSMLKKAVWCLESPEKHFAEVIRYSVVGLGTDEDTLTRAIVTRAEIDMQKIKEEYKKRYKTTVTADVIDDTSGYYKDILLKLVGSENP